MKLNKLLIILSLLLIGSLSSYFLVSKDNIAYYDEMVQAATKTQECFNCIKEYKEEHGLISEADIYESGMIGIQYSHITTSGGDYKVKRTNANPSFAALFIKYFHELGLESGDEIAIQLSGSFPGINTSCLVAADLYGLKTFVMAGVCASNFGANDVDFTYIDMVHLLKENDLISLDIDLVSAGGHNDLGSTQYSIDKENIVTRIQGYGYTYYEEDDYETNISYRTTLISCELPNLKCFINCGGHTVSMGTGSSDICTDKTLNGIIYPRQFQYNHETNIGLIEYYLKNNVNVINMLHIQEICVDEGITFNPSIISSIGKESLYKMNDKLGIILPACLLSISLTSLIIHYLDKKNLIRLTKNK